MSETASPRNRIKEMEVMVAEAIRETHDTTTLVFFTGNDRLDYRAGHFLTIDPHQFRSMERFTKYLEDVKGKKEPPRAYSMCSAPHEKHVAVTVKEELYVSGQTKYPPLLSPLLVHRCPPGTKMVVTGFTGPYHLPDGIESQTDHVVHVTAGSGSVPNVSMLKDALVRLPKLRHTFIYSNKTYDDIIFRDQLDAIAKANPAKVKLFHALTRVPADATLPPGYHRGRITADLLRAAIPDPATAMIFACGPAIGPIERAAAKAKGEAPAPRFLETAFAMLEQIGVPKARIKHESFG